MKMYRRILAGVLAVLMCASFAACGDKTTTSGDESTGGEQTSSNAGTVSQGEDASDTELIDMSDFEKYPEDGLPDTDLGGYTFTVATSNVKLLEPDGDSSDYEDAILDAMEEIENRFHCTIEMVEIPYGTSMDQLQSRIVAGEKVADIIMTPIWESGAYVGSGLVQDLKQIPHLQLDKPWWNQSMNEVADINGKVMTAVNSVNTPIGSATMVFYNKDIAEELELGDLYQLVENKEWTLDKFIEFCQKAVKDLDGNSKMDEYDRYGFGGPANDILNAFMVASGVEYVKDDNGKKVVGLNDADTISTLNQIHSLFTENNLRYPDGGDWSANIRAFTAGLTLFFPASPDSGATYLRNMESDFGILPLPMGGSVTDYRADCNHNTLCTMIPISNSDVDKTGLILEAISFATWQLTPERFDYYETMLVRDDESMNTIADMLNKIFFDRRMIVYASPFSAAVQSEVEKVMLEPNGDVASVISAVTDAGQAALDDFYAQG